MKFFFCLSAFFDTSSSHTVSPSSYIEMLGPQEASDSYTDLFNHQLGLDIVYKYNVYNINSVLSKQILRKASQKAETLKDYCADVHLCM